MSVFYFNRMPVLGPWGGGNKTLTSLVNRLASMGHTITGELRSDVDIIFCVDPRPSQLGVTYEMIKAFATSKKIPLIQRVGDVGTHGKPDLMKLVHESIYQSDRVIFTSNWARHFVQYSNPCHVIPNGAMPEFYKHRRGSHLPGQKLRVVTHHWSNNPLKGIALYESLSSSSEVLSGIVEFTYIGRSSPGLAKITRDPMTDKELASELPLHDVYLSASLFEAGANHIVEAMACGLPVIYCSEGGSIPEYCDGRGLVLDTDLMAAFDLIKNDYVNFWSQSQSYTRTMNDVIDEYLEVLCDV